MIFKRIQDRIKPELDGMNMFIQESIKSPMPILNSIVCGYLGKRGKQIRPLLVILSAELLGGVNERVLHAGASIEILHNASLIHDDVIDQSMYRRGIPTVNAVWDNHIAVLTGDYLVSKALDESILAGSMEVVKLMSHLADILSEGELHQIFVAREHDFSIRKYVRTVEMKTAILFESCVRMGAEASGVGEDKRRWLERYAYYMGMCFQIRDDIFDYIGQDDFGKASGHDLREGKVTLPLLYALQTVSKSESEKMKKIIEKDELADDDVATLTKFAVDNGGIEFCRRVMDRLREKALFCLSHYPECEARKDLEDIFTFIINRTH